MRLHSVNGMRILAPSAAAPPSPPRQRPPDHRWKTFTEREFEGAQRPAPPPPAVCERRSRPLRDAKKAPQGEALVQAGGCEWAMSSKYAVPDGALQKREAGTGDNPSDRRGDASEYLYVDLWKFRFSVCTKSKAKQQGEDGPGDSKRQVVFVPPNAEEHRRAKELAERLQHEFVYTRRTSSRPAIIITLSFQIVLCAYQTVFYHTAIREGDGSRPADGNYGLDAAGRSISIVCAIILAGIAATDAWANNIRFAQLSFLFFVLLLSVSWAYAQLLQAEPDYGQLISVQAFIFTFLPLNPFEQLTIAVVTWLVYGVPHWFNLVTMNSTYPLIIIGVGMLEAIAHGRRYASMMEGFLEKKRIDTQRDIMTKESLKCDGLLRSMLPRSIIVKLELGEAITPERFDVVTVIFAEICHFGKISQRAKAHDLVNLLNDVFSTFDGLIDRWSVHKVETVCQVYMAVAGCPQRSETHAADAGNLALDLIHCVEYLSGLVDISDYSVEQGPNNPRGIPEAVFAKLPERRERVQKFFSIVNNRTSTGAEEEHLQIHVGLNSGPIRAGVVGINNPRFKLFGDTVNTASRMESTCEAGKIQASPSTTELLRASDSYLFNLEERGKIQVKGKGEMLNHCGGLHGSEH